MGGLRLEASPIALMRIARTALVAALALSLLGPTLVALQQARPAEPQVAPASGEAEAALGSIVAAPGLKLSLFAAEPLVANPVALHVNARGEVYVAESFRLHAGVTDMREHLARLDEELANKSVEERVAMFARWADGRLEELYGTAEDRVRLLRDTDGDGRADEAIVFAGGFRDPADGVGAGLLEVEGDVYFTCIPHLWLLRDEDGDGVAELRRPLSSGYGVHVALLGHDLHGLALGPDQRLYFSCGDRGFRVQTPAGILDHAHTGAVLRCEVDGSGLEVFATGLRNPQELAFDDTGELFTGDNNSDGGDRARIVHVVEGSDSGWRFAFQYIESPVARGPWNDEALWKPAHPDQAAYLLPPVANFADGPSGLAWFPFAEGDARFIGRFFLCDFRGSFQHSGIHAFALRPEGAGFALAESVRAIWSTLATDCEFGPGGDLWFSDWVEGWSGTGKGRIFRAGGFVAAERGARSAALLASELATFDARSVVELLDDADMRVRQRAHFELARRAESDEAERSRLVELAGAGSLRARRHALWALGIVARKRAEHAAGIAAALKGLLGDPHAELRAQAARALGELRWRPAVPALAELLADPSPRVRSLAAIALGRIGDGRAYEALLGLARSCDGSDRVLRHAAIQGLAGCARAEQLESLAADPSRELRLAAVVALRRRAEPAVARFLGDADALVVLEAARAIHDRPIPGANASLAALLEDGRVGVEAGARSSAALVRRVLAANRALPGEPGAERLARFAARVEAPAELRAEALAMLAEWGAPSARDPVLGEWRPIGARSDEHVRALVAGLDEALRPAPRAVAEEWIRLVEKHRIHELTPELERRLFLASSASSTRVAAFRALSTLHPRHLQKLVEGALRDPDGELRAAAFGSLDLLPAERALPLLREVLAGGELPEQRAALAYLGRRGGPDARNMLQEQWSTRFERGLLPAELELELALAVESAGSAELRERVDALRAERRERMGEVGAWLEALQGGDPANGRRIFHDDLELSCLRCHPDGEAAATGVGPDLRGVGRRLSRLQLLESILQPNARIAPGYASVLVRLSDDSVLTGRILDQDRSTGRLRLQNAEGELLEVALEEVDSSRPGLSAMPEGLAQFLDRREMRDLIEYLARL